MKNIVKNKSQITMFPKAHNNNNIIDQILSKKLIDQEEDNKVSEVNDYSNFYMPNIVQEPPRFEADEVDNNYISQQNALRTFGHVIPKSNKVGGAHVNTFIRDNIAKPSEKFKRKHMLRISKTKSVKADNSRPQSPGFTDDILEPKCLQQKNEFAYGALSLNKSEVLRLGKDFNMKSDDLDRFKRHVNNVQNKLGEVQRNQRVFVRRTSPVHVKEEDEVFFFE